MDLNSPALVQIVAIVFGISLILLVIVMILKNSGNQHQETTSATPLAPAPTVNDMSAVQASGQMVQNTQPEINTAFNPNPYPDMSQPVSGMQQTTQADGFMAQGFAAPIDQQFGQQAVNQDFNNSFAQSGFAQPQFGQPVQQQQDFSVATPAPSVAFATPEQVADVLTPQVPVTDSFASQAPTSDSFANQSPIPTVEPAQAIPMNEIPVQNQTFEPAPSPAFFSDFQQTESVQPETVKVDEPAPTVVNLNPDTLDTNAANSPATAPQKAYEPIVGSSGTTIGYQPAAAPTIQEPTTSPAVVEPTLIEPSPVIEPIPTWQQIDPIQQMPGEETVIGGSVSESAPSTFNTPEPVKNDFINIQPSTADTTASAGTNFDPLNFGTPPTTVTAQDSNQVADQFQSTEVSNTPIENNGTFDINQDQSKPASPFANAQAVAPQVSVPLEQPTSDFGLPNVYQASSQPAADYQLPPVDNVSSEPTAQPTGQQTQAAAQDDFGLPPV